MDEMVAPVDEHAAEMLSVVLHGKGAFRRFKDALHLLDEHWLQAWHQWETGESKLLSKSGSRTFSSLLRPVRAPKPSGQRENTLLHNHAELIWV